LHDLQEGGTSCNVHLNAGAFHPTHGSINGDRDGNIHVKKKIATGFGNCVTIVVGCERAG